MYLPDGTPLTLSPGEHNQLQALVIDQFVPQFVFGPVLFYMGDTADKSLYVAEELLAKLGIRATEHDKLPDIILHDTERNWLFLIEVVTSEAI